MLESCACLVVATKATVSVWSLLTCRKLWTKQATVLHVACSPQEPAFAVAFGKDAHCTTVCQYRVDGEQVATEGSVAWPPSEVLAGLVFAPVGAAQGSSAGQAQPHRAMALTVDASVYALHAQDDALAPVRAGSADLTEPMYRSRLEEGDGDAEATAARRRFMTLFGFGAADKGARSAGPAANAEGSLLLPSDGVSLDAMLEGPSHNLPPMPLLTERFLQMTLLKTLGGPPPLNAEQGPAEAGRSVPTLAIEEEDDDADATVGDGGDMAAAGRMDTSQDAGAARAAEGQHQPWVPGAEQRGGAIAPLRCRQGSGRHSPWTAMPQSAEASSRGGRPRSDPATHTNDPVRRLTNSRRP